MKKAAALCALVLVAAPRAYAADLNLRGRLGQPPPAVSTGYTVQIGAFPTAEVGQERWEVLRRRMPGALNGKTIEISSIGLQGKTAYRTRILGFVSLKAAQSFCRDLQRDRQACFVPPRIEVLRERQ